MPCLWLSPPGYLCDEVPPTQGQQEQAPSVENSKDGKFKEGKGGLQQLPEGKDICLYSVNRNTLCGRNLFDYHILKTKHFYEQPSGLRL